MRLNLPVQQVRRGAQRRGLTLIELIVVLMILIALAGVLIPMMPSMLTRAHNSSSATNLGEITRAIITYQQLYQQYPNNWDALGDGQNMIDYFANGQALPASQGGPGTNPGGGELTALTLTGPEATTLTAVGITQVQSMTKSAATPPAGFDPTFNYYSDVLAGTPNPTGNAVTIGTGTVLAGLDPAAGGPTSAAYQRCVKLNLSLTGRYVALGLGPRNSMIGKTVQSAPVHFGDTPVLNPEFGYERFVALFKVSDSVAGPNFTQAQLAGVAEVEDTGMGGIDDHLQGWYQATNGGS